MDPARELAQLVERAGELLAVAAPALQLHTAQPSPESFPKDLAAVQTYNRLQAAFPGKEIPANVVVRATDLDAPQVRGAIAELKRQALATGLMHEPILTDVNEDATVANIAIAIDGDGTDAGSIGEANWYLPRWLEWLPRLEHGGSVEPVEFAPALEAAR